MVKHIPLFHTITMVLLLMAPILSIYGNPTGWSYEEIVIIPLSTAFFLYWVLAKGNVFGTQNPLSDGLTLYFLYWGIALIVSSFIVPLAVVQSYLVFFLFFGTFHTNSFIKIYKTFALVCIFLFFAQEISYYISGNRISGIISTLPLHTSMGDTNLIEVQADAERSCSFFSEPAQFAQFLLPLFAIEIFYDKGRRHFLYAILIGIVLMLLRSGNGLFGLATILLFALLFFMKNTKRYKGLAVLIYVIIVAAASYYFINSNLGETMLGRQAELNMHYQGGSRSGFVRIWRGYYVFGDYNPVEMIFGCPNESRQISHVISSGFIIGTSAELYFNCFQKILLNTGLIGVGLFVFIIVRLWRGNTYCGKALLTTFIVISLMAAIFMSSTMIIFLVLAYGMKNNETTKINV